MQFTISGDTAILNRNASKTNTVIVGGFSRLLHNSKQFLSRLGVTNIVTYANRDLTPDAKDSVYFRHGFVLEGNVGETMQYFVSRPVRRENKTLVKTGVYNRQTFMKYKLSKFNGAIVNGVVFMFDENITEQENLSKLNIYPIYNSGCFKFVLYL